MLFLIESHLQYRDYSFLYMQLLIFSEVNNHSFLFFFLCFVLCVPITNYFPYSVTAMKISEYFKPSTKRFVLFAYFSECLQSLPSLQLLSRLFSEKQHPDSCLVFHHLSPEQLLHPEYHCVFFLGFLLLGEDVFQQLPEEGDWEVSLETLFV